MNPNQEETLKKIAMIFQNNVGNRLSVELANGMIQEIAKILQENGLENNVNNSTTDSSPKK